MSFNGNVVSILPRRGLNNGIDPVLIEDDQSPDCQNVRFVDGSVQKRDGFEKYISTAVDSNAGTGVAQLSKDDGTNKQIAVAGAYIKVESGGAWSDITGGLTVTANANNIHRFAQLTDILVATNNVDNIWKYSGSGNAALLGGSPPDAARDVVAYKNYLIFGNVLESGTRTRGKVVWSGLNNAETYAAADVNTFLNQTGDEFVAFAKAGDQLFVFFERSIHQMVYTGDAVTPFVFPTAHPSIGSISTHGIVEPDGLLFFPSKRGIYVFDGSNVKYISGPIEETWRGITSGREPYIQGLRNDKFNEIWWACSTGGSTNDTILAFNYEDNTWTIYTGINANCFGLFQESLPLRPVFMDYSGRVHKLNSGAYQDIDADGDTTAIVAYCKTKPTHFGNPAKKKTVSQLQIICDQATTPSSNIIVSTGYNLAGLGDDRTIDVSYSGAVFGTAVFGTDTFAIENQTIKYCRPNGHGRLFQAQVKNSQESVGMNVSQLFAWVRG